MNNSEVLFWKVFHNKYLFNLIVNNYLPDMVLEYDNIDQYYINNRIKFSEIVSLEFMSKRGLFSILKDKIQTNQTIHISRSGIIQFISNCFDKQLIKMVFKKYQFEFTTFIDIIYICIISDNLIAFKVFIKSSSNNGYQYTPIIHPISIFEIIKRRSFKFNKSLLKLLFLPEFKVYFYPWIKQRVLKMACSNKECRNVLVSYILNNPCYYEFTNKEENKIKFSDFMLLDSKIDKLKLFNFKQVSEDFNNSFSAYFDNSMPTELDDLKFYYFLIFYDNFTFKEEYQETNETNQLLLQLSPFSNLFYLKYFISNDVPIKSLNDKLNLKSVYIYTFTFFSINGLLHLIENNVTSHDYVVLPEEYNFQLQLYKNQNLVDELKILEFLKCLIGKGFKFDLIKLLLKFIIENFISFDILRNIIENVIPFSKDYLKIPNLKIKSFKTYKWFINYTIPLFYNQQKERKIYIGYNQFPYNVNSKERIEFILSNSHFYKDQEIVLTLNNDIKEFINCQESIPEYLLFNLFKTSIKECNIKTLKLINIKFQHFNLEQEGMEFNFKLNITNTEVIQLFNYFNESRYRNFNLNNFIAILNAINKLTIGGELFDKLIINFKSFENGDNIGLLSNYFIKEIFNFNLQSTRMLLNNHIISSKDKIVIELDKFINQQFPMDKTSYKLNLNYKDKVQPMIYLLIDQFSNNESFNAIFGHLYLIACKSDITFDELLELNQKYQDHNIPIELNSYHIFYYLTIKYKCLKKMVIRLYSLYFDYIFASESLIYRINYNNANQYLNFSYYTLDKIKELNFNQLFLSFRYNISTKEISTEFNKKFKEMDKSDLQFLIEIGQFSLIFEILNNIHQDRIIDFYQFYDYRILMGLPFEMFKKTIDILKEFKTLNPTKLLEATIINSRLNFANYVIENFKFDHSEVNFCVFTVDSITNDTIYFLKSIKYKTGLEIKLTNYSQSPLFDLLFIEGRIEICDFLLSSSSPNENNNDFIKLERKTISSTINNDNVYILKYYYDLGKFNNDDITILKSILSNDIKLKHLLWWFK